jgi:plasmid stabilization system protein ParE
MRRVTIKKVVVNDFEVQAQWVRKRFGVRSEQRMRSRLAGVLKLLQSHPFIGVRNPDLELYRVSVDYHSSLIYTVGSDEVRVLKLVQNRRQSPNP